MCKKEPASNEERADPEGVKYGKCVTEDQGKKYVLRGRDDIVSITIMVSTKICKMFMRLSNMDIFENLSKSCFKGLMRLEPRMMGEKLSGSQNGD